MEFILFEDAYMDLISVWALICAAMLACHIGELIHRLSVLGKRFYLKKKNSDQSKMSQLKNSLSIFTNVYTIVIVLLCTATVFWFSISRSYSILLVFFSFVVGYLILHLLGIWKPTAAELESTYGDQINFGYCFAWQYYLGYLKIVLPDLEKRILKFEKSKGVEIKIHKLMLLMPKSCQLVHDLSKHPGDEQNIDFVDNLETIEIDRAGSKGRKYRNSVYRIDHKTEPIYCCMEGIPIINSLPNMQKKCGLTLAKMEQEFCNFQKALKLILEDEKLDHLVELIVYQDQDDKDRLKKISDVIKDRLVQIL